MVIEDVMTLRCNGVDCGVEHANPKVEWTHETKLDEDAGLVHTDDCGFFDCCAADCPDCGTHCTSGQPGVMCRVRTAPTVTP